MLSFKPTCPGCSKLLKPTLKLGDIPMWTCACRTTRRMSDASLSIGILLSPLNNYEELLNLKLEEDIIREQRELDEVYYTAAYSA